MHGTLEVIPLAWKFNSKQLLSKTLNSRMHIIETRAVLNMVKKEGKWAPEAKQETVIFNFKQLCKKTFILGRILRKLALQGGTLFN